MSLLLGGSTAITAVEALSVISACSDTFRAEKCIYQPLHVCQMTKANPLPLLAPILHYCNENPFFNIFTLETLFEIKLR
jgi:hypothetical protein